MSSHGTSRDGPRIFLRAGVVGLASGVLLAPMLALPAAAWGPATTQLVSVTPSGVAGNAASGSGAVSVSQDGRFIAFDSNATDLVPKDTNKNPDVFVRDRVAGVTTRVSVGAGGVQANSASWNPSISADGRYVLFLSAATNLDPAARNGIYGEATIWVFVRDRVAKTTRLVSYTPKGKPWGIMEPAQPFLAPGGRYAAFVGDPESDASAYIRDIVNRTTLAVPVSLPGGQACWSVMSLVLSATGRYLAFDAYGSCGRPGGVFVWDRVTGATTTVSVDPKGRLANGFDPSISADGRYVSFTSAAPLVPGFTGYQVYVRDLTTAKTVRVGTGNAPNGSYGNPATRISGDGHYVLFKRNAAPSGIYLHSLTSGKDYLVSTTAKGARVNALNATVSGDGRVVAFMTTAKDVAGPDTNGVGDVFVKISAK